MRSLFIKIVLLILFCLITIAESYSQKKKSINFIGLNPSVTVEPFYEKGEFDINVFPIVYQKTISQRVDIRIISIVNYGIRKSTSSFSHIGFQTAFPHFIIKKTDKLIPSKGFFVAPGFGITRNLMEKHTNFGLWIEPGYNLLFDDKYSLSFSIQFGATHFWYDSGTTKWGNHFGIKIIFGKWF